MTSLPDLREASRNQLLRRVDWRFLLPKPNPSRSACFARGTLEDGVRMISEHVEAQEDTPLSSCDLVVAVDPDPNTIRRAFELLRPRGAFYAEWRDPGQRASMLQMLQGSGLDVLGSYWAWPDPESGSTRLWVPLDAVGALRYVREAPTLSFIPGRFGVRSPVLALHRLRMSRRLASPTPMCTIALKAADAARGHSVPGHSTPKEPALTAIPEAVASALVESNVIPPVDGSGVVSKKAFFWMLLTPGRRSISKVVGLAFREPSTEPMAVIKLPRIPEAIPALKKEADVLNALHRSRKTPIKGVPRVLFSEERDGMQMLGLTYLPGVPLWIQLRRSTYRSLAHRVTKWLADLAGESQPVDRSLWGARLVDATLETFSSQYGDVLEKEDLQKAGDVLNRLDSLPIVFEQRDLGPWNVLVAPDGSIGVLDWESGEREGLPLLDLVYFLTFQAFFHKRAMGSGRFVEVYRKLMQPSSFVGRIFSECQIRYAKRLDMPASTMHPLRLLTWMIHSRSEYVHLSDDLGGTPPPEALRDGLFYRLWREELAHGDRVPTL